MADRGIIMVPTLLVTQLIMDRWEQFKAIPMMRSIPVRAKRHVESFQIATAAGVTMAAGTDMFFGLARFEALPDELERIAERWRPYRAVAARMLWQHYLFGDR